MDLLFLASLATAGLPWWGILGLLPGDVTGLGAGWPDDFVLVLSLELPDHIEDVLQVF